MDSPFKLWMTVVIIAAAGAIALGGINRTGKIQNSTLNKTEIKAQGLLD